MELIRKQADNFIRTELGKMNFTDNHTVIVDAIKSELYNYYRLPDKLTFLEEVGSKIKEAKADHLTSCTSPLNCKEVTDYDSMLFFIEQEVEQNGIVSSDLFTNSEIASLNTKLDKLFEEIQILKTGHVIIYDDIIEEFTKLKNQYYLDKKTWRQAFFGKIFEMTLSGVISETLSKKIIEIFGDIFNEEQIKKLLG